MGTSGVKLIEFYFLTFFLCAIPLQYPPGFLQLITAIVHTKHRQELIPSNIDLSNTQPGYYGEGSVDLCQGPTRRCATSKDKLVTQSFESIRCRHHTVFCTHSLMVI